MLPVKEETFSVFQNAKGEGKTVDRYVGELLSLALEDGRTSLNDRPRRSRR